MYILPGPANNMTLQLFQCPVLIRPEVNVAYESAASCDYSLTRRGCLISPLTAGHPTWPTHARRKTIVAQQQTTVAAFLEPLGPESGSSGAASQPPGTSSPEVTYPTQQSRQSPSGPTSRSLEPRGQHQTGQAKAKAAAAAAICNQLALFWCLGKPPLEGQLQQMAACVLELAAKVA